MASATNGNVRKSTLKKVECIVCQKVAYPPIMLCKNWHLVCNNCRLNLTTCPGEDCHEEVSCATKSGVSENFLDKYVLRCKYFKEDGSGCMEACLKEEAEEFLTFHHKVCPLREVKCLVPGCHQSIQLTKILQHFESIHFMQSNLEPTVEMNASEMIMQKKSIANETCGDKTYKCIPSYLRDGDDVFLAIFRISSLRQPVFEISTVIHPYYAAPAPPETETPIVQHVCKISATNQEDSNASYKFEGPLSQIFPLSPALQVQDETAKLKWNVGIQVFRKNKEL